MRAMLWHCKNFRTEITGLANRPVGIKPEEVTEKVVEVPDAVVALITVEEGDDIQTITPRLAKDIQKMCKDTGHPTVILFPFAHLSNKLASKDLTLEAMDLLQRALPDLNVKRTHFGSDKSLLLDLYGHRSNVRYREF